MRPRDCRYLRLEKSAACPQGLTFDRAAPVEVSETWYCRHPFHGVEVPVGNDRSEALSACAACSLPGGGSVRD
ncbi:MAG TPA: hypothetical protein VJ787_07485 [Thermoleophilia bacterium]|nr:hypothetical protein [Thermoleophilia bacterium]